MFSAPMFAPHRAPGKGAAAYRANAVEIDVAGADAHRLVVLLFEGYAASVADALGAIQARDTERKCQAITRAMRIVDEGLRAHLNFNAGGTLARDLDDLYGYLGMRLMQANLRNDEAALAECQRLMEPLHAAWLEMGRTRAAR